MPGKPHSKTEWPEPELSGPARIKALVQRFRVCWGVHPVQILAWRRDDLAFSVGGPGCQENGDVPHRWHTGIGTPVRSSLSPTSISQRIKHLL